MRELRPVGIAYLDVVTDLLQRQRLADPGAGLWEAADLQWWYTRDPHPADAGAAFWLDGGVPVVGAVFTRWSASRYGCDVLGDVSIGPAWEFVRARCAALTGVVIEMAVAPEDDVTRSEAERAGFADVAETYDITWLDAADRPAVRELPSGYLLVPRTEQNSGPHPMIKRNGDDVEERLRQCSLYDPALDLAVVAPDGEIAGYAMFWADARTEVGLVEPMRVEDAHSGRGIAGALLRSGLDRLAGRGCSRLKVSHDVHNEAARRLYVGAGFRPQARVPILLREAR